MGATVLGWSPSINSNPGTPWVKVFWPLWSLAWTKAVAITLVSPLPSLPLLFSTRRWVFSFFFFTATK